MALNLIQDEEEYFWDFDDGSETKPRFWYSRMKGAETQRINMKHTKETKEGTRTDMDSVCNEVLGNKISRWANVMNGDNPVDFSRDFVSCLPLDCKMSLYGKIAGDSEVSKEEEKNS